MSSENARPTPAQQLDLYLYTKSPECSEESRAAPILLARLRASGACMLRDSQAQAAASSGRVGSSACTRQQPACAARQHHRTAPDGSAKAASVGIGIRQPASLYVAVTSRVHLRIFLLKRIKPIYYSIPERARRVHETLAGDAKPCPLRHVTPPPPPARLTASGIRLDDETGSNHPAAMGRSFAFERGQIN